MTSRIGVSWTYRLPFWFPLFFDSVKWPCYQNYVNQITLNHAIQWNWTLPIFKILVLTFLESNTLHIFSVWGISLDGSINFSNFPVRSYLFLIQKDHFTHACGLSMWNSNFLLHRKLWIFLFSVFDLCYYFIYCSVIFLFPLLITIFFFVHKFWCCNI